MGIYIYILVGGWDYCSQYIEKYQMLQTTNRYKYAIGTCTHYVCWTDPITSKGISVSARLKCLLPRGRGLDVIGGTAIQ